MIAGAARRPAHPDGPAQRETSQSFRTAARQLTPVAQCSLGEPMPVSGLPVLDSQASNCEQEPRQVVYSNQEREEVR